MRHASGEVPNRHREHAAGGRRLVLAQHGVEIPREERRQRPLCKVPLRRAAEGRASCASRLHERLRPPLQLLRPLPGELEAARGTEQEDEALEVPQGENLQVSALHSGRQVSNGLRVIPKPRSTATRHIHRVRGAGHRRLQHLRGLPQGAPVAVAEWATVHGVDEKSQDANVRGTLAPRRTQQAQSAGGRGRWLEDAAWGRGLCCDIQGVDIANVSRRWHASRAAAATDLPMVPTHGEQPGLCREGPHVAIREALGHILHGIGIS
mmetsp:Transcript_164988/g.529653  ORF Transcript_164988/g.529653 Transcript_164988/m.529653 type:complete len:265 (+) Transcript_164988:1064-1858(+)